LIVSYDNNQKVYNNNININYVKENRMLLKNNIKITNKKFYKHRYQNQFAVEAEWLEHNAVERVNSIQYFLKRNSIMPKTILELGCGTGALLRELKKRKIGEKYVGIDYSEEAITYLKNYTQGVDAIKADITSNNFLLDGKFDLVILVHVLQHLEDPDECLKSIMKKINFSYLIVKVPFEDTFLNKIIPLLRWRKHNPSGSLQLFNLKTFKQLLVSNNFSIIDQRRYVPVYGLRTLRVLNTRYGWSKLQFFKKILTSYCLPKLFGPVKKHVQYSHSAVLCRKKVVN
jgi:2-polyprenyl-3-methyl-5-hydroxy-6-metoxy-1,4-benzoquinol methylase